MLVRLTVENFALFERCDVELAAGLNALTGETGAGKSLLLDALECILGGRASTDLIRQGADTSLVEAFFTIGDSALISTLEAVLGVPLPDGEIILRRRLSRSGRFSAEANGRAIPVSTLRQAGDVLVDIHGQNEHQRLVQPAVQLDMLDAFGGSGKERSSYAAAYDGLRDSVAEVSRIEAERDSLEKEKDFLAHRVRELEAAALKSDDELDALLSRRQMAANHQQIVDVVTELHRRVYYDDDSMTAAIERLAVKLSRLEGVSKDLDRWKALLEEASVTLAEAGREAGALAASMERSQNDLERIDDRIAVLKSLCRKYAPTLGGCRETLRREKERLDGLGSLGVRLEDAAKAAAAARKALLEADSRLSKERHAAAGKLTKKVEAELHALGMREARFRIDFTVLTELSSPQDVKDASPAGLEICDFMLMPNPGEGWAPLGKIASGGEVARAMLALKTVLAGADKTPVLVFDEIDADIGGRLGEAVGRKLRAISSAHQVIVVTHLPQIAAFAQRQFRVEKSSRAGRTVAAVEAVAGKERLAELAEMLRGREKAKEALEQAEKMLAAARDL